MKYGENNDGNNDVRKLVKALKGLFEKKGCCCQHTANVPNKACKICAGTGFPGRGTELGASQEELDRRFYGL